MDFDRYITETGVTVTTGGLPDGWWGAYDYYEHKIILRARLGATQRRSVLAHEIAHAWFQHKGTTPGQEREASMWAARRLIDAEAFIDAVRVCEHRTGIAQLLSVMPADVDAYLACLSDADIRFIRELVAKEEAC